MDFAANHTNPNDAGEFGLLYDNGTFLAAYNNDSNGYFHHNPGILEFALISPAGNPAAIYNTWEDGEASHRTWIYYSIALPAA